MKQPLCNEICNEIFRDPRVSSRVGGSLTTIHTENEAKACGHVFSVAEK